MSPLPSFDHVLELPASFDREVSPDFIDENGHMNIGDYLSMCSWAVWQSTRDAGIDERYMAERDMSLFTVEHHIRYVGELLLGERFSVHTRLIDRSARAVHAMAFVLDRQKNSLACSLEVMLVHVSFESRSSTDLPDDVIAKLDERIARDNALDWAAPTCGVMGIRR